VDSCQSDSRGAENIFWPERENRLALVVAGFSFQRSRFGSGGWVNKQQGLEVPQSRTRACD